MSEMYICTGKYSCGQELSLDNFEIRADTNNRRNTCKNCRTKYVRQYKNGRLSGTIQKKDIPIIVDNKKVCVKCNLEQQLSNFTKRSDSSHGYRMECNDCKRGYMSIYLTNIYNKVRRDRMQSEPERRLVRSHRTGIYNALKKQKLKRTFQYLGCSFEQLQTWLVFQFSEGMTLENYGTYWTIDHILPVSLFDLTKESNLLIALNWKNLQPSTDNFVKSNKLRIYEYFNAFISVHRFIKIHKLHSNEYQGLSESLNWLRGKLR
jgi:hypothetical protein